MEKIQYEISSKLLTIGPDFKNHKGGIGALIDVYSKHFEVFHFICSYRVGSFLTKLFIYLKCLVKIFVHLIKNNKIKVIHIHGASYGSFYRKFIIILIVKYLFRKKVIYHIHGGGFKEFYLKAGVMIKCIIRFTLTKADTIICLSSSWFKFYNDNFNLKNLIILPNVIDEPKYILNNKSVTITLLFLGLISKDKGIYNLIEVISRSKEKYHQRVKLIIGGNGETKVLNELIKKNNLEDIIEFKGWISGNQKSFFFNNSSIFILPSNNEGLPISILEAMAYAKPVIATKVGGIPEVVKDHVNGILISPGNPEELENAIDFFISNPELIEQYGNASLEIVKDYFPSSVIPKLNKIYSTLLENE